MIHKMLPEKHDNLPNPKFERIPTSVCRLQRPAPACAQIPPTNALKGLLNSERICTCPSLVFLLHCNRPSLGMPRENEMERRAVENMNPMQSHGHPKQSFTTTLPRTLRSIRQQQSNIPFPSCPMSRNVFRISKCRFEISVLVQTQWIQFPSNFCF